MRHTIEINGERREIHIRPMDEDFIVYRKMYVPPITRDNIGTGTPDDPDCLGEFLRSDAPRIIESFLRKQIRAIGSCAILAWDDDGVVGKMYFTTREMWHAFRQADGYMCVEHESMPRVIQGLDDAEMDRLLESESKVLRILCFNIGHFNAGYHQQGIVSAMLETLKGWARERGWRKLEVRACPSVLPFDALDSLPRGSLERRGFRVDREEAAPDKARYRQAAVERVLTSQYRDEDLDGRLYPRDIAQEQARAANAKARSAAQASDWQDECGKDYLMVCDL